VTGIFNFVNEMKTATNELEQDLIEFNVLFNNKRGYNMMPGKAEFYYLSSCNLIQFLF
jgi:hypothetical protein